MKILKDILYKARIDQVIGSTHIAIEEIAFDSRNVLPLSLFVAVRGTQVDGHAYIAAAIKDGAVAVICEELPQDLSPQVTYIQVKNSAESLGFIASNFYDVPSEQLKLIAITGTNGKTTVATLLHRLFRRLGKKAGLLSTVVNKINDKEVVATHTTPDAVSMNRLLREMVDQGCKYCFIEASSHAIEQHRMTGLHISGAVFTNISHDHLDYHKTFNAYITAKKKLFDQLPSSAFALVNNDDIHGEIMLQNCKAKHLTFGLKTMVDYKARIVENQLSGLQLNIGGQEVFTRLIGDFNAYNLLAVYGVAIELEEEALDVLTELSSLESVEGRFQYVQTANNITAVIDYAHTPDALKNVLSTIKNIRTGNETVISVIGCGGDRDKTKRPEMARIACELSDKVILTSDNPRTENPDAIIEDMKAGIEPIFYKKYTALTDRREAIKLACSFAQEGDIILIAGKGHEKYQDINGIKLPFDDVQVVQETLKMLEK
jgi:UDP-N-acetylmuramoyl-L-alanyl-D-glutamate--2,6-diaminopimelate ligase